MNVVTQHAPCLKGVAFGKTFADKVLAGILTGPEFRIDTNVARYLS